MANPTSVSYSVTPPDRAYGGRSAPVRNPALASIVWPPGANCSIPDAEWVNAPIHPKVLDMGAGGWNGYRYWMAYTPFPTSNDDSKENPCIVASNDGDSWIAPSQNPIFGKPTNHSANQRFYSDTHLSYRNGVMYLIWRYLDNTSGSYEAMYVSESTDGVTWGAKQTAIEVNTTAPALLSPALEYFAGEWWLWVGRRDISPTRAVLRKGPTPYGPWSAPVDCALSLPSGRELWHLDVVRVPNGWAMLIADRVLNAYTHGFFWLAYSKDGLAWSVGPQLTNNDPPIYRSSLVRSGAGFDLWVTDWSTRKIRRARINDGQL